MDDLNAEIGEGEEEEGNFDHLEKEGENGQESGKLRSRNVIDKKTNSISNKFSLNEDEDEENKTIEIEEKPETKQQESTFNYDVIDELFEFFDQEQLEPILCGYFNKVMQALLAKSKGKVLSYLLIQRKGDIFNLLLKNLQHHSLAILMVELLQVKITS